MIVAQTTQSRVLSIPKRIKHYTFHKVIGKGCTSVVLRATEPSSCKSYAVKIMSLADIRPRQLMPAIRRELSILKAIQHKHIIAFKQYFVHKDLLYVFTENGIGGDLFSWIVDGRTQQNGLYTRLFHQILLAVQYIHQLGFAHNDIKAENIVLDLEGNVKLIDFGFAKGKEIAGDNEKCGTLAYAPPEMLTSGSYDPQAVDIWSLGILLYVMVIGAFPYPPGDHTILKKAICSGKLRYPRGMNSNVRQLVREMTRVNPKERPSVDVILKSSFFDDCVKEPKISHNEVMIRRCAIMANMDLMSW
jgi:serine/threonine protein kinase